MAGHAISSGVVFLVLAAFLSTTEAVNFVRSPGSVVVPAGGTALLRCSVDLNTGRGTVTVYWYKAQDGGGGYYITGGTVVYERNPGSERYSLETSRVNSIYSYNLKISDVEPGDAGQYQCMVIDGSGSSRTPRGSLSVLQRAVSEPLSCSYYPDSPTVGQTVTFSCTAPRGVSPELLSWWRDGGLRVQPSAHLSNTHGISFVKTLDNSDNFAEFTCLLGTEFDVAGQMNCSVTPLAVPIRAEITPSTALAVVTGSATFRCRGTAIPPVTRYRWIYGQGAGAVKISESKRRFTVVNSGDSSTLTIGQLTVQDNNKIVRCIVLNEITKTIGSAGLQVFTHLPSPPPSPSQAVDLTPSAKPPEGGEPDQTKPSHPTTAAGFLITNEQTGASNATDDAVDIYGCADDCGERVSSQQEPDTGPEGSNTAIAASVSVFGICAVAVVLIIVYVGYTRRGRSTGRVVKRKWKNKPLQRLRSSLRSSVTVSTSNQELVHPNSVRLKTIEVIVNSPPPEWQFRLKDVATDGQDVRELDDPHGDALYAQPDKTRKRKHQQGTTADDGAVIQTKHDEIAPSAGHYLSVEHDDCFSDGISDASTWDMSSVDSGCEEELDEPPPNVEEEGAAYAELDLHGTAGAHDKLNTPTQQTDYANIVTSNTTDPGSSDE